MKLKARVEAHSRLHFSLISVSDAGRCGGLGVALEEPGNVLEVKQSSAFNVAGEQKDRVEKTTKKFIEHYGIDSAVELNLMESIPDHVGLGSGTQLALSVGAGLSRINGLDISVMDLARVLDRAQRSGVGCMVFESGGLVVDYGGEAEVFRRDFPRDWIFLLVVPGGVKGLSGVDEDKVFQGLLSGGADSTRKQIVDLVSGKLLTSLEGEDIQGFGEALTAVNRLSGSYYRGVQGGLYLMPDLVESLLGYGAYGVGQSSWGPTVYGLTVADEVGWLESRVKGYLQEKNIRAEVYVSGPCNTGATVSIH